MFEPTLRERMYKFVSAFQVVHKRHIYRFFGDMSKHTVERTLTNLLNDMVVYKHGDHISLYKTLPTSIINYAERTQALYVMCLYQAKDIKWFELSDYPEEILFVNNAGVCYTVTVFDSQNWLTKYALVKRTRQKHQVSGIPDPINYIAVIHNVDLIPKLRDLGFTYYATLDSNGHPELLRDEST